ncbi:hypothetical protein COV18_05945 [Candidatus Woesearchaeota archaeon CG10_big_fil_rev_8_21_14_0_10_37_12]|nr:MAG: hypothetical protein COV18_05945 [Candidatus Woesearchaeota archaeon CG10_big_fil_rev_8_21_14_0_10_37_12]
MTQTIISQTPISAAELHDELKRIKKRDDELGFRAQKTVDYLESMHFIDVKKAKELEQKLTALDVPRLRDVHFNKLIDVLPITEKDVKVVLQGYNITVTNENCKKIADVVAEFASKK